MASGAPVYVKGSGSGARKVGGQNGTVCLALLRGLIGGDKGLKGFRGICPRNFGRKIDRDLSGKHVKNLNKTPRRSSTKTGNTN